MAIDIRSIWVFVRSYTLSKLYKMNKKGTRGHSREVENFQGHYRKEEFLRFSVVKSCPEKDEFQKLVSTQSISLSLNSSNQIELSTQPISRIQSDLYLESQCTSPNISWIYRTTPVTETQIHGSPPKITPPPQRISAELTLLSLTPSPPQLPVTSTASSSTTSSR